MKNYLHSTNINSTAWTLIFVSLFITSTSFGQTNPALASVRFVDRIFPPGAGTSTRTYYYDIDYPGGNIKNFFDFWRKNGFTNDSFLFAGDVNRVYISPFKIKGARLNEIAKSIEFVAGGALNVEVVEKEARDQGNLWRVKFADVAGSSQIKTRATALPTLFAGPKPEERIRKITDRVEDTLVRVANEVNHADLGGPHGRFTIIDSEKTIVAVGTEAYVEAITSALEAAEKVAESESVVTNKAQ